MIESRIYKVQLTEPMLGTVTKDPEVYRTYIESKKPETIQENESESVEKIEEKGWTGFHRDENGIFVYDYFVKGFIKNSGNVLKEILKVKALRSKIDEFLFVFPRRIYIGKEPDGVLERPLRAMTMQGPRVTLARSDYVAAGLVFSFEIRLLKHKDLTWGIVDALMDHGQYMGFGQFRNGSYGRFTVIER